MLAEVAGDLQITRLAELPQGLIAARRGSHTVLLNFTDETLSAWVSGTAVNVGPRDVNVIA